MANKKVSQLVSKPSVLVTDLFPIADPTTGQLYKTTISDLGTAIGSGVSSVNGLVGAVVLDTDDIQELASPTNRWFTDTRARAALSASSPLAYNSGTGVFSLPQANGSTNGFLSSADWTTFNAKQAALSGTGFVKISGTTISYDNSTYLTTSAAASTYLALSGGTLTGALNGTSATFTGDLTLSATNPRLYFTDTDNNPDYFISNTDGTFTVYDVTNSTSRFTIGTTGNGTFGGNLTVGQIIRSGGTSSQFLKADGSVDSTAYLPLAGGTLTGALFATSASFSGFVGFGGNTSPLAAIDVTGAGIFSSSVRSSGYYLTGMTSGSGALYYNSAANRVTVANYNANGIVLFEVNGGSTALTLNSNLSATFAGALSGTSATFSGQVSTSYATFNAASKIVITNTETTGQFASSALELRAWDGSTVAVGFSLFQTFGGPFNYAQLIPNQSNIYAVKAGGLRIATGNAPIVFANGNTDLDFSTARLTIASTGAATFSSSVTANGSFNGFQSGTQNLLIDWSASSQITTLTNTELFFGTNAQRRMTITNGGNVGIGTTSPFSQGSGATSLEVVGSNFGQLYVNGSGGAAARGGFMARGGGFGDVYLAAITNSPLLFGTNDTERMRISSGGLVGIGTDIPVNNLQLGRVFGFAQDINSGYINANMANSGNYIVSQFAVRIHLDSALGEIKFLNAGSGTAGNAVSLTERMRITSGGDVFIGSTSTINSERLFVRQSSSANLTGIAVGYGTSANQFRSMSINSSNVMTFNNGTNEATLTSAGAWSNASDARLKKNIVDIKYGLNTILESQPRSFNRVDVDGDYIGFIAQELLDLIPEVVSGDLNSQYCVDYGSLVAISFKAIQELKAELDTLKNK